MSGTERGRRLKIATRLAIFENISALNRQRKAAIQAGSADQARAIQESIDALHDRQDDLSFLSLEALEDSEELRQTIADLRRATKALKDEADKIKSVAEALTKGAEIIDQTVEIIAKLRQFAPI